MWESGLKNGEMQDRRQPPASPAWLSEVSRIGPILIYRRVICGSAVCMSRLSFNLMLIVSHHMKICEADREAREHRSATTSIRATEGTGPGSSK